MSRSEPRKAHLEINLNRWEEVEVFNPRPAMFSVACVFDDSIKTRKRYFKFKTPVHFDVLGSVWKVLWFVVLNSIFVIGLRYPGKYAKWRLMIHTAIQLLQHKYNNVGRLMFLFETYRHGNIISWYAKRRVENNISLWYYLHLRVCFFTNENRQTEN